MVVRWAFLDLNTSTTYTFEVNPNEGGSPSRAKRVSTVKTTAPLAKPIIFEGSAEPNKFTWGGVLLSREHLQAYLDWYTKRHQIKLTDDLGRESFIYISGFSPKRVRAARKPWKHTYTAEATTLDWS